MDSNKMKNFEQKPKPSEELKRIASLIAFFWQDRFGHDTGQLGITDIEKDEDEENIKIGITLKRPGLLIGKYGRTLDDITNFLTDFLEKQVTIQILESPFYTV